MTKQRKRSLLLLIGSFIFLFLDTALFAKSSGIGVAKVASNVISNLGPVAQLITAISYVAGMSFGVAAVMGFKKHKDNPTQESIAKPIAYLFIGSALLFIPSVFSAGGGTIFPSGTQATVSGVTNFKSAGS